MSTTKKKKAHVRTPLDIVAEELTPIGRGQMMRGRVGKPEAADALFMESVNSYITLNMFAKVVEKRLEAIKPVLHKAVEEEGNQVSETGSIELVLADGNKICREKRTATTPDQEKLRALLQTRGIDLDKAFDEVPTLVLNASKLKFLVDSGKLDKKEVEDLHKVSWAIKCEASDALEAAIEEALLGGNEEPEAPSEKAARKSRKK